MHYSSNIVFINPPNIPFTSRGILIEPIDLLGLASWTLQLGYDCSIIDMDVKELTSDKLDEVFINGWPKIIVIVCDYHIPLHDSGANNQITQICSLARQNQSITILGGKSATFSEESKLLCLGADIFVRYEMEYILKDLFSALKNGWNISALKDIKGISYLNNNHIIKNEDNNQKVDLNQLPISDRTLIDLKDYIDVRTMLSSRGCNLKCTFCHVPGFWGVWRSRSAKIVVDEIEYLVNNFNAEKILFLDDNATAQPKRMKEISQEIIHRNIKVAMGCLGTINKFDEQTIHEMYQAGFKWIHYGAESGDDIQLKLMGKKIDVQKTKEVIIKTQKAGLRVRTSWIMDMPDLTEEGLLKTEELILSNPTEEIRLHFLTLRLGSILHKKIKGFETPQFIHNSKQNFNISGLDSELIEKSLHRILKELSAQGYAIVKNAHEFKDIQKLKQISPELKIVSLCPLRYGLGWI